MSRRMVATLALLVVSVAPLLAHAEADKKTERVWKAKCASCHGADGKAQTDQGAKMGVADYTTAAWQKAHGDPELKQALLDGVQQERGGKKQEMSSYKDLGEDQVDALVAYLRTLGK